MFKLQTHDQQAEPEVAAPLQSMLSGDLTTAVNALQAAIGSQLPTIMQSPIGQQTVPIPN